MSSSTEGSSESESIQTPIQNTMSPTSINETPITSTTTPTLETITPPTNTQRKSKSYGSLTDTEIKSIKSFIKKAVKDDKADRLSRKELSKVSIARMRMGVDEYDELLDNVLKERSVSEVLRDMKDMKEDGEEECKEGVVGTEEVSREELEIISLKRQLASMRRRS